jgi:hypothetical protein
VQSETLENEAATVLAEIDRLERADSHPS